MPDGVYAIQSGCGVSHLPGGVTSIYTGTGRAIFGVPFFEQEMNFGVSFLVRL